MIAALFPDEKGRVRLSESRVLRGLKPESILEGMSLQELQEEAARLSREDRARLRAHLDSLEVFADPQLMEKWTRANRAAEEGQVVSRDEAIARLKAAGKQIN